MPHLVKVGIAGFLLGQILIALGAEMWVVVVCAFGMGMTWRN